MLAYVPASGLCVRSTFEFSGSVIRAVPPGAGTLPDGHVEGEFQSTSPACKCGHSAVPGGDGGGGVWSDGSLSVMTSLAFDGTIIVVAPLGATTARRRRTPSQGRRCMKMMRAVRLHSHSRTVTVHTHTLCVSSFNGSVRRARRGVKFQCFFMLAASRSPRRRPSRRRRLSSSTNTMLSRSTRARTNQKPPHDVRRSPEDPRCAHQSS